MLEYDFIIRALIVGIAVSICASLLGVNLVLKRYSMIGDGLSHVGFGALCVAAALNFTPLYFALPCVVVAAFFLLRLSEHSKIKSDSAIALISVTSLAFGVIITSFNKGANVDVFNFMFGSILSATWEDVYLSVVVCIIVVTLFSLFYHKIFTVTFDESFAKASGINPSLINALSALLAAITIVVGMRIMGALLISGLIIFPSLTSMQVFKTYKSVVISSVIIAIICLIAGIALSYEVSLPVGACIVALNAIVFVLFFATSKVFLRRK